MTNRLGQKFELYQTKEQASSRKTFSTIEHLHTDKILIEKTYEYNITFSMAFIDFRKAFIIADYWSIIRVLRRARIDKRYINMIQHIQNTDTLQDKLHDTTDKVNINREMRQIDSMPSKLLDLVHKDVLSNLNWSTKGIKIRGKQLNNLKFRYRILIFAQIQKELQAMLKERQIKWDWK